MQLLTKKSRLTEAQQHVFQQGACCLYVEDGHQVGVWTQHTPVHETQPIIAIGACLLESSGADIFLRKCISVLEQEFPGRPIIGPMNGNTWMKHRLIIESGEREPFLMEPVEPESLLTVFEAAGFTELSRYSSSRIDLTDEQPDFSRVAKIVSKQGIDIRSIDEANFEQDLSNIHQLSLASFSNNFLYTPLPREAFMHSYLTTRESIDRDFVLLAWKEDILIGFLFCIPDHTEGTLIVKTLATSPEHRAAGLGTYLVAMAQQRAKEKGYTEAIHALQYESNSSLRISQRFAAEKFRTYGLMIKQ